MLSEHDTHTLPTIERRLIGDALARLFDRRGMPSRWGRVGNLSPIQWRPRARPDLGAWWHRVRVRDLRHAVPQAP